MFYCYILLRPESFLIKEKIFLYVKDIGFSEIEMTKRVPKNRAITGALFMHSQLRSAHVN